MSISDQVLSEFMDAWSAGRRPRARDYLARVPAGSERDDLADQITTWLEVAPAPEYSAATRDEIRAEPIVQQVFSTVGDDAGAWQQVLPRLRSRAGLSLRDVAAQLVERLQLGGTREAARATGYLEQMERGELRADRVSRRLLDALGGLLGVTGAALADLGGGQGGVRLAGDGGTLFRATTDPDEWIAQDIEVLSRAAMTPAPPPMDQLDRLFCGGPDG